MKLNWIFPQSIGIGLMVYYSNGLKKDFKHARMASLAVSNHFWARLKSGFSEHLAI